ncbi:fructose-specific PTS transporter subunit EIIC [Thermophilibacter provencensis]|uniref:fructose-specific PTS transporter subunit EIIC n=1 Tax=Thermophilibacter provencensis TaxID=1852386 RepID=UPI003AA89785
MASKSIVAVTNCPAGIAHTYMVAEAIQQKGEARGYTVHVETQGASGVENVLTIAQIREADYVILALGKGMTDDDRKRFAGKKVVEVSVSRAIKDMDEIMADLEGHSKRFAGSTSDDDPVSSSAGFVTGIMSYLMAGVSAALPFVIGGGMLMAFGSILAQFGAPNVGPGEGGIASFAWVLSNVGSLGFTFMIPIMGAYIANAIGDKPALAPAFICTYLANNAELLGTETGAGFLGSIAIGLSVGYFVKAFRKIKLPKNLQSLMGFFVIPVVTLFVFGLLTYYVLGPVMAWLMSALISMLGAIPSELKLVAAFLVGCMLAFDLGGPVNKAAWFFSFSLVASGVYDWYGIVGVVGCIPPRACGIASLIRPQLFSEGERDAAIPAIIVGSTCTSEPAIPYVMAAPIPMMAANLLAGGIAGVLSMLLGVQRLAPGIGVLDPVLGLITPIPSYYIAFGIGLVLNVVLIVVFKSSWIKRREAKAASKAQ